ncbi:MAG: ribosome maturation factor RimM [Bacillota bacterium]|nr:ribosome maturation factor RimM [Bacillota bacterium]
MNPDFITIGEVVNTHGHRGAVRVLPLTDFPERFQDLKEVILTRDGERVTMHIERVAFQKRFVILSLREVPDMHAAERLRGAVLQIPREQACPLPEGRYYLFEIIGLQVFTADGERLGTVVDVLRTGANDVYVVRGEAGRELLIPALKSVVAEINPDASRMVVDLPEGLRE